MAESVKFTIRTAKHLENAKAELLRCAEIVHQIQSQRLAPEWQKDIDCMYYRDRIRKLEVLIDTAEVEDRDGAHATAVGGRAE